MYIQKGALADYAGSLEPFINQIPDYALFMLDSSGHVMSWNAGAERLKGYKAQEIIGRHFSVFYTTEDLSADKPRRALEIASRDGAYQEDGVRVRKDRTRFWATVTITALRDKDGTLQGFAKLTRDITERKANEAALREREAKYRALYEHSNDAILLTNPEDGTILAANPAACSLFGCSEQELTSLRREQILDTSDTRLAAALAERAETGGSTAELTFIRKGGERFEARATSKVFADEAGRQLTSTIIQDITARRRAEDALRQSEEKFRATFEHAPLGVAECTLEGRFIDANPKLLEMLGYTREEIAQLSVEDVTHPGDIEETLSNLRKLAAGEADSYVVEKRYIRKDRSLVWVNVTTSLNPIHGKSGCVIAMIEDVTARKKAEEDLKRAIESSYYQATHDMLTGLANRAAFSDRLKEVLAYAKRDGHLVAIHLLDLDRFKSINDTLGHHVGDLLLKEVAKRIKAHTRATDVAARLGGDEFVVIQTHLAEPSAAAVLAGKLVEGLGRNYVLEGQEVNSGTSIGIALYPNDADDMQELVKLADLALYDAKNRGRFNYQFYREELGAALREAQRLEQELERALRENEFCLHYQPQFDLKSGRITGIEALLRWCHPTRGKLAAAEFIHDAERASLMLSIGEWTLQTACRQHKEWIDSGLAVPLILNLSSRQLRDPRFPHMLKRILEDTGVPPSLLQLEMRESVLWDPKFSTSVLKQMKENGIRLALDDFGADLTALATLARFPLDAVKPGRNLVKELPSRTQEASILAAIIGVAHNLKIAVCADGVETAHQLAAVKEQGCDFAQGYLLSSPLETDEMNRLIGLELAH